MDFSSCRPFRDTTRFRARVTALLEEHTLEIEAVLMDGPVAGGNVGQSVCASPVVLTVEDDAPQLIRVFFAVDYTESEPTGCPEISFPRETSVELVLCIDRQSGRAEIEPEPHSLRNEEYY